MVGAYLTLLLVVAAERLVELRISRRNAAAAMAQGGIELGQAHYRWMKVLHTSLLVGAALEVVLLHRSFDPRLAWLWLSLVVAAQALRYWCIATLGECWNVRVIVVPGRQPVTNGPYRFLRHPNYVAVALEGFALPMVHGAWLTALIFSVLNALLLRVRIRCEEGALENYCDYDRTMAGVARFVPTGG